MALHGCPVFDRDNPGHGHRVDRKIIQKTALGIFYTYIFIRLLSTYISDQKMCTMYPFGARFFAKIRLSIRRFIYVRFGPKRNSNCVQLMQFYGVGALLATIINKRFYYFKMKEVYVAIEDVEEPCTVSTRWISGLLFSLSIVTRSCAAAELA